jgi:DNA polymerase V
MNVKLSPAIAEMVVLCYQSMNAAREYARGISSDPTVGSYLQTDFFHSFDSNKQEVLMKTLDKINQNHGKGTLKFAACGIDHFWKMLSQMKSPRYTTNWNELKKV